MNKVKKYIVCILLHIVLSVSLAIADPQLYVEEIDSNPDRYYNRIVQIRGYVTDMMPSDSKLRLGDYTLTDNLSGQIHVWTRKLPVFGEYITVKAIVNMDAATSIPYLWELDRDRNLPATWKVLWLLTVIVSSTILTSIVLLIVLILGSSESRMNSVESGVSHQYGKTDRENTTAYLDGIHALFTIVDGPSNINESYIIEKKDSTIGRDGDIRLPMKHMTVSNQHARLTYAGTGRFLLTHLSRTNLTRVNGQNVADSYIIQPGDEVQLGGTKLLFEVQS